MAWISLILDEVGEYTGHVLHALLQGFVRSHKMHLLTTSGNLIFIDAAVLQGRVKQAYGRRHLLHDPFRIIFVEIILGDARHSVDDSEDTASGS